MLPQANISLLALSGTKVQHRNRFSPNEDIKLIQLVKQFGVNSWEKIQKFMPKRTTRQIKDRWYQYLSPDVHNNNWTAEEDQIIREKFSEIGPQWKIIAQFLKNRTCIGVRNRAKKILRHEESLSQQECPIPMDTDFSQIPNPNENLHYELSSPEPESDEPCAQILTYFKENFIKIGLTTTETISLEIQHMSMPDTCIEVDEF